MTTENGDRFEQLLTALEREVLEATDEEILEAAKQLRMDPEMKGSAALVGVTSLVRGPFWHDELKKSLDAPRTRRSLKDTS